MRHSVPFPRSCHKCFICLFVCLFVCFLACVLYLFFASLLLHRTSCLLSTHYVPNKIALWSQYCAAVGEVAEEHQHLLVPQSFAEYV